MKRRISIGIVIALLLSLALFSIASAHAKLVSSDPAAGSKLTQAPAKVTLVFSEEISAKSDESNVTVTDEQGNEVGKGGLDSTDLDHKTQTVTLKAGLGDSRRAADRGAGADRGADGCACCRRGAAADRGTSWRGQTHHTAHNRRERAEPDRLLRAGRCASAGGRHGAAALAQARVVISSFPRLRKSYCSFFFHPAG